jgi:hypothetical protein
MAGEFEYPIGGAQPGHSPMIVETTGPGSIVSVTDAGGHALNVQATGEADMNIKQYASAAVGAGNAVHVQPGTGAEFTITPKATAEFTITPKAASEFTVSPKAAAEFIVQMKAYRSSDSTYQPVRLDQATHALKAVDYAHSEIHKGAHFMAHYYATGKNDGETINIYLKTPNTTKWGHMVMQWSASGAAFGRIREAPTVTSNTGTNGQAINNNNRNVATASDMVDNATSPAAGKFGVDVTITAAGTIIYEEYAGAAKNQGGIGRNDEEIILDQNAAYVFEVESDAAGLTLSMNLLWYEHTNEA